MFAIIFAFVVCANGLLHCDFQFVAWTTVRNYYNCCNAVLSSDGNLTHILSVTWNHLSGKSNVDVKGYRLVYDQLQVGIPMEQWQLNINHKWRLQTVPSFAIVFETTRWPGSMGIYSSIIRRWVRSVSLLQFAKKWRLRFAWWPWPLDLCIFLFK